MRNWISTTITRYTSSNKDKHTQNTKTTHKQTTKPTVLPGNIAAAILEYQYRCESQSISSEDMNKLIALYSHAVEYYQSIGSSRFRLYQRRMQQFLQKRTVDQFLRGNSVSLAQRRQAAIKQINESRIKSVGEVNRLLVQTEKRAQKSMKIISNSISFQESCLELRKRKRTTRSFVSSKTAAEEEGEEARLEEMFGNITIEFGGTKGRRVNI